MASGVGGYCLKDGKNVVMKNAFRCELVELISGKGFT